MPLRPITNPFKELGLRPHHTEQDVKKAYRALALKYHPDKAGQKGEEKMKLINAAHEEIMSKRLARLATPPRAAKQRSEERRRQQKYTSPTPSSHKRRSSEDADDIEIDTDDSKDSPSPTQPSHDDDEGSEKGAGEVDPNYYSEAGTQYEAKEDIRFKHDWQFILLLLHAYVEAATSRQYRIQGSRAIDRFDRAKIILRQLDYVFKGTKPKSRAEICRRIGRIFDYLKRVEVSDCPRLAEARAKDASLSFDRMAREAGIDDFLRDKTVEARGSSRSYARSAFDESGEIWTADEMWFEAECERQADLR